MASGLEANQSRLERFDGSDPTLYKRWKRRAALMLISLPSTYAASKLGPKLMEYVTGDAELAVEHLKVEDIAKTGGEQEIFKILDERYMPLEKDDMSEALKEYFYETQIRSGESMKNFCTRVATSHRKLQDQGVTLPAEVQGWFLIRKLHLESAQEAMLLTATAGSYKVGAVVTAVKAILANQRGINKQKETYAAERVEAPADVSDDEELVQVLAAELQGKPEYHEEELIEVYETYKQVRSKMNEVKKTRGYRSFGDGSRGQRPWKLTGSISAQIEQAKRVSRCHKCGQLGHWKRECRKGQMSSTASTSGASNQVKEVHIVGQEDWTEFSDADYLKMFHDVDNENDSEGHEVHVVETRSSPNVMLDSSNDEAGKALGNQLSARTAMVSKEASCVGTCTDWLRTDVFEALSSENQAGDDQEASGQYDADLESHGVPDTACRRSLIGEQVLKRMEQYVVREGNRVIRKPCSMIFKFGNAGNLTSEELALVPCSIAGRRIVLQLAVLPGTGAETPLLMSKELLRTLGVVMDMSTDSMHFKTLGVTVRLKVTRKGHYAVPLFPVGDEVLIGEKKHTHTTCTQLSGIKHRLRSHLELTKLAMAPKILSVDSRALLTQMRHGRQEEPSGQQISLTLDQRRSSRIVGDDGGQVQGQAESGGIDHGRGLCSPEELHSMGSQPYRTRIRNWNASTEVVCGAAGSQQDPSHPTREGGQCQQSNTHPGPSESSGIGNDDEATAVIPSSFGVESSEHPERQSGDGRWSSVLMGGEGSPHGTHGIHESCKEVQPPDSVGAGTKDHARRRQSGLWKDGAT